jgi:hypothetical protein
MSELLQLQSWRVSDDWNVSNWIEVEKNRTEQNGVRGRVLSTQIVESVGRETC